MWAIGAMFYAMIYGHLPFWADTEDEFIDRILNAPLRFDPEIAVSDECKDLMKGMLSKDPEKRLQIIDIMNHKYYIMDEEDIEKHVKKAEQFIVDQKL